MTDTVELPHFETMYLEIQTRADGSAPLIEEVLDLFRERGLVGVAVSGARFGLDTAVIAKVAMTMADDTAVVYVADADGTLAVGEFTGSVCEWLARSLNTTVVADEYVLYQPNMPDEHVEFIELDPRRQSIDQPAGFPNEWRVSPTHLESRGAVFVDGDSDFTAAAISADTQHPVQSVASQDGRIVHMPAGVVELPAQPCDEPKKRVVLFAQAGEAKYAHLVMGKPRKQLRLTLANLPKFQIPVEAPRGSVAREIWDLISNASLVAGSVQFDHPSFPHHILPLYERLTDIENTHSFFSEVAEQLRLPQEFARLADCGFDVAELERDTREHNPTDASHRKRGWFRR